MKYLEKSGYNYTRAGRSFGLWDIIAYNTQGILFIQAKYGQGPRAAEMARLKAFSNYPKAEFIIKRQVWLWKKGIRKPIINDI